MPIVLVRVDERLMHGQVILGWGSRLGLERYVIVDRELASAGWEQDLYRLGVPTGVHSEFVTPEQATDRMEEWASSPHRTALLTRGIDAILDLEAAGALESRVVNLGGLHHAPGRRQVLPFLHLDLAHVEGIRRLDALGIELIAQELPDAPKTRGPDLVRRGERAWSR